MSLGSNSEVNLTGKMRGSTSRTRTLPQQPRVSHLSEECLRVAADLIRSSKKASRYHLALSRVAVVEGVTE